MPVETINISIPAREDSTRYPILIGPQARDELSALIAPKNYSRIAIISDTNVAPHWMEACKAAIGREVHEIVLPPGETHKFLEDVDLAWSGMHDANLDRRSLVINLGGGVVGDLGGFAAATWVRGMEFIQVPTTLLSQVDASVGGKLGFNFRGVKNAIGSFQQPRAVVIDLDTLGTLPPRELISGYGEVLKHGLIKDRGYFEFCGAIHPVRATPEELQKIISGSVHIKAGVVAGDELEKGPRKVLNFGHTFGHAFESLCLHTDTFLLHGEAIAIGMVAEAQLSVLEGLLDREALPVIEAAIGNAGLPVRLPQRLEFEAVTPLLAKDKKSEASQERWSLIDGIGSSVFNHVASADRIRAALEYVNPTRSGLQAK